MKRIRLNFDGSGLDYDRDYGSAHRTGWSAVHEGRVVIQLTSFWRAVWRLARAILNPPKS